MTAMTKAADFHRYFDRNRIYLPESLCTQLERFNTSIRSQVTEFAAHANLDEKAVPAYQFQQQLDASRKVSEYFDKEVPVARAALEAELRAILGASSRNVG